MTSGAAGGEHLGLDELGGSIGELFELEGMAPATTSGSPPVQDRHPATFSQVKPTCHAPQTPP
jgi:hypothetical protein